MLKRTQRLTAGVRPKIQSFAAAWCGLMVLVLAVIQLARPGTSAMPPALWLLFSAVWVFGAAMLWWYPTFGAIGTALYGVILGAQVLRIHGGSATNWIIAIGSFAATALSLAVLAHRRRSAP